MSIILQAIEGRNFKEMQRVALSGIFGIDRAIDYIAGKVLHVVAAREESKM